MAREIWKEHRWWIIPLIVAAVIVAVFISLDVATMPAHGAERSISKKEMKEFISLLRIRAGRRTGSVKVIIPAGPSKAYIRYVVRNRRAQLVIIYNDPIFHHHEENGVITEKAHILIPTAFLDVNADGTLERKFRIIPKEGRLYMSPQSKRSDQSHYEWIVLALLDYFRSQTADV